MREHSIPRQAARLTPLEPKTNAVFYQYSLSGAKQMTTKEQRGPAALRERLKIISDESSRRNPDQHMAQLRDTSFLPQSLAAALPH